MFIIEDELHAEPQKGRFESRQHAIAELQRRATISWDEPPNRAPCVDWRTCGRKYEVVEYDDTTLPWKELSREFVLDVSAAGVNWIAKL